MKKTTRAIIAPKVKNYLNDYQEPFNPNFYSQEFQINLTIELSIKNPHIPPWVFSSTFGATRESLFGNVHYAFDTGELAWVAVPKYRIKYLGGSLTSISDDIKEKYDNRLLEYKEMYDEMIKKNPHVPPWSFLNSSMEQFENRLISAFNEGEIIWIKNPSERNNRLKAEEVESSKKSDNMSMRSKILFSIWLIGLYYNLFGGNENTQWWILILNCIWVFWTIVMAHFMFSQSNN